MTQDTTGGAIARRSQAGALATEAPANPWGGFGLLKPHAGGLVQDAPRTDALATISAGYKNQKGYPERSRDGTIYLHDLTGRASGLKAALAARENKGLTIALIHNDPKDILQQRFAWYSQTKLLAYGDERAITVIHNRDTGRKNAKNEPIIETTREIVGREENPGRYAELASQCKAQSSLYFALADWTHDNLPRLIFPDGVGFYRLRFTSLNSAEAIRGQLYHVAGLTGGRVAGIPLELAIDYREVVGPDGTRRQVPVWTLVLKPPRAIELTAGAVRNILAAGIEQAQSLALAPPRPETVEVAEYEGPDVDLDVIEGEIVRTPTPQQVRQLQGGGGLQNPEAARKSFFTTVGMQKSALRNEEVYRPALLAFTHGRTDSMRTFTETCSGAEWRGWMEYAADFMRQEAQAARDAHPEAPMTVTTPAEKPTRSYEELFPPEEDERPQERAPEPVAPSAVPEKVHKAAVLTGAPGPVQQDPTRPLPGATLSRAQWTQLYKAWQDVLKRYEPSETFAPLSQLENGALKEATLDIIARVDNARAALEQPTEDDAEPELEDAF